MQIEGLRYGEVFFDLGSLHVGGEGAAGLVNQCLRPELMIRHEGLGLIPADDNLVGIAAVGFQGLRV